MCVCVCVCVCVYDAFICQCKCEFVVTLVCCICFEICCVFDNLVFFLDMQAHMYSQEEKIKEMESHYASLNQEVIM